MSKDDTKKVKKYTNAEWVNEFSKSMAVESYKLLHSQGMKRGFEVERDLLVSYMSAFIAITLHATLNERPEGLKGPEQMFDYVHKNYADLKMRIEDAVSQGFMAALTEFSGKDVDYYCQVKPVPEPKNKPC